MSFLEKKRNAIMSVRDTVRGYRRTQSGASPLILTDCYPDAMELKIYGETVQDSGTYITAEHRVTDAECNYSTRKLWFYAFQETQDSFYVFDGFAYWSFFADYDLDISTSDYYIDCKRLGVYEVAYDGTETRMKDVSLSFAAPSGYTDFASRIYRRDGNVFLSSAAPLISLGQTDGRYVNISLSEDLISGTVIKYDSFFKAARLRSDKIYIQPYYDGYYGNYYIEHGGAFYLLRLSGEFSGSVDEYYLNTSDCIVYDVDLRYGVPEKAAEATRVDSLPLGYTELPLNGKVTETVQSLTAEESSTPGGAVLAAQNTVSHIYPDTEHPTELQCLRQGSRVTVRGKNLWSTGDTAAGWATPNADILSVIQSMPIGTVFTLKATFVLTENTYGSRTASATDLVGFGIYGERYWDAWTDTEPGSTKTITATYTINGQVHSFYMYGCGNNNVGQTGKAVLTEVQLEIGSAATAYEPYFPPQELTVPCDLYEGQVWCPGTGEVIGQYGVVAFDGTENVQLVDAVSARIMVTVTNVQNSAETSVLSGACSHVARSADSAFDKSCITWYSSSSATEVEMRNIVSRWGIGEYSANAVKAFLARQSANGTPLTLTYPLAAPVTEQYAPQVMEVCRGTTVISGGFGDARAEYYSWEEQ